MNNIDKQEQDIHDAFSQISVDTEGFKRRISVMNQKKTKRQIKFPAVAAVTLAFVIMSGVVYAAVTGGLEFFQTEFDPSFINYANDLLTPAYAEDQGIRVEIIGAEQGDHSFLLYLTIQDVTGENRLIPETSLDLDVYIDGLRVTDGGRSTTFLHFDESTNTAYLEMSVSGNENLFNLPRTSQFTVIGYDIPDFSAPSGQMQSLVAGRWEIEVNMADNVTDNDVIIWTDVTVGKLQLDYIRLSPLSVVGKGTHEISGGEFDLIVEIEVNSQLIEISGSSSGVSASGFDFIEYPTEPIDVEAVTAIIINGYRIEVPK